MPARNALLLLALAPAAALLAACGGADPDAPADTAPATTAAPAATTAPASTTSDLAIPHATGATDVILRVTVGGGFVPPEFELRSTPTYTLYGDGTAITPAAVPAIFPGPAVLPLATQHLDEAEIQALLAEADAAGLLDPPTVDYGDMGSVGVTDMATTTLEVHAGDRQAMHAAYALDAGDPPAGVGSLTPEQVAARTALQGFIRTLYGTGTAGDAFVPAAYRVYVGPYRSDPQPGAAPVVWPLASDLATAGTPVSSGLELRCIDVDGADAAPLAAALATATEITQWTASETTDATFSLTVRPLLPDEGGCDAAGGGASGTQPATGDAARVSDPDAPTADLAIAFDAGGDAAPVRYEVRCQGADVHADTPDESRDLAAQVCPAVAADATLVSGQPATDVACTEQYGGPQTATVEGIVLGDIAASASLSRVDGCAIARWDGLFGTALPVG